VSEGTGFESIGVDAIEFENGVTVEMNELEKVLEEDLPEEFECSYPHEAWVPRFLSDEAPIQLPVQQAKVRKRSGRRGKVTAVQIAEELGLPGREVRARLRALGLKKPDIGWAWDTDEAEEVKRRLQS